MPRPTCNDCNCVLRKPESNVCVDCLEDRQMHTYGSQAACKRRLKLEVFNAYGGPQCNCCGETLLSGLSIDHIAGDGALHRRQIKNLYAWLKNNNWPSGFQVLCMTCNFSKRTHTVCEHQGALQLLFCAPAAPHHKDVPAAPLKVVPHQNFMLRELRTALRFPPTTPAPLPLNDDPYQMREVVFTVKAKDTP